MTTTRDLWHAAGRAARDDRKRFLALQGVLWSGPALVLASAVAGLFVGGHEGKTLARPLEWVLAPLASAYEEDRDLSVLVYLLVAAASLVCVWGLFGGAIYRLAAVDLAQRRREEGRAALAFARRHWTSFVGARLAFWAGVLLPLVAISLLAWAGTLPGWIGGILLTAAVVAGAALALASVVVGSVALAGGFLTGPTIACEDSDAFDAVSRAFTYVAAGLPRAAAVRLLFLGGVVLGSGWRLARTVAAAVLAVVCLRAGAGAEASARVEAVLGALGKPPDALRLGVLPSDYLVAAAVALAAGALVTLWLADLASRILCARVGVYLVLRRDVDRVPVESLRTPPRVVGPLGPEAAGFAEVSRIGEDG